MWHRFLAALHLGGIWVSGLARAKVAEARSAAARWKKQPRLVREVRRFEMAVPSGRFVWVRRADGSWDEFLVLVQNPRVASAWLSYTSSDDRPETYTYRWVVLLPPHLALESGRALATSYLRASRPCLETARTGSGTCHGTGHGRRRRRRCSKR